MAPACLAEWSSTFNMSKTERTSIPSLAAYRKKTGGVAHYTQAWVTTRWRRRRRSPKAIGQNLLLQAVDIVVWLLPWFRRSQFLYSWRRPHL